VITLNTLSLFLLNIFQKINKENFIKNLNDKFQYLQENKGEFIGGFFDIQDNVLMGIKKWKILKKLNNNLKKLKDNFIFKKKLSDSDKKNFYIIDHICNLYYEDFNSFIPKDDEIKKGNITKEEIANLFNVIIFRIKEAIDFYR